MLSALGARLVSRSKSDYACFPTYARRPLAQHLGTHLIATFCIDEYLPRQVNSGSLLTAYTLDQLHELASRQTITLPICSLGTPCQQLFDLGPLVLPPLYHEAMDGELKSEILSRVGQCFPYLEGTARQRDFGGDFQIVELPPAKHPGPAAPRVLAFSVDTAVEEHGPHLPLMTDTIQSYGVLQRLASEVDGFHVGPPAAYGHLTWGVPFGMSIDVTPPLLTRYVAGFTNAILDWAAPEALYVVDVHGSMVHRNAIQEGLRQSRCDRWSFRWLHEPLVEFAGDRGDQHAGGVETSLVHHINPNLVDGQWWPSRLDELTARQMSLDEAVELSPDLNRFVQQVEAKSLNGIVGDVRNFYQVDAELMMNRMLDVARADVEALLGAAS